MITDTDRLLALLRQAKSYIEDALPPDIPSSDERKYQWRRARDMFLQEMDDFAAAQQQEQNGRGWVRWKTRPEVDARDIVWLPTVDCKWIGKHKKNEQGLIEVYICKLSPLLDKSENK